MSILPASRWTRIDNYYRHNLLPKLEGIRGFTRLGMITRQKALERITTKEDNGVKVSIANQDYLLANKEGAKTLITERKTLPEFYNLIKKKENQVVVDAGAFHGIYSLLAAKEGIDEIYTFEPDPKSFSTIEDNFRLNSLEANLNRKALMDENTKVSIPASGKVGNTVGEGENEVEAVALDTMLDEVDVIKLDVEGAEFEALRGMEKILDRSKPVILLELHKGKAKKPFKHSPKEVTDFLKDKGYNIDYLERRRFQDILVAQ